MILIIMISALLEQVKLLDNTDTTDKIYSAVTVKPFHLKKVLLGSVIGRIHLWGFMDENEI